MKLLVSACLLGCPCRYDGRSRPCDAVLALREKHILIPFCPEIYGGLPTPRTPAEIRDGRLITKDGREVDAKRILGVMGLGAKQGQEIVLKTEGADEDAAMDKLSAFLEANL